MSDDIRTLQSVDDQLRAIVPSAPATAAPIEMIRLVQSLPPRDIKAFKIKATSMACLDEEAAGSCIYAIPRDGKIIEGPSVRLAEICQSAYGRLMVQTRIVHEDQNFIYAEANGFDLETINVVSIEKRRRISGKRGRYSDDMIAVTANAASSICYRDAVFKLIPRAYVNEIYRAAKRVAVGDAKTLATRRDAMFQYFNKLGVTTDRVLATLDRPSLDNVDLDDVAKLHGLGNAIKEREISIDDAFPALPADGERTKSAAANVFQSGASSSKPESSKAKRETKGSSAPEPPPSQNAEGFMDRRGKLHAELIEMIELPEEPAKTFIDKIAQDVAGMNFLEAYTDGHLEIIRVAVVQRREEAIAGPAKTPVQQSKFEKNTQRALDHARAGRRVGRASKDIQAGMDKFRDGRDIVAVPFEELDAYCAEQEGKWANE